MVTVDFSLSAVKTAGIAKGVALIRVLPELVANIILIVLKDSWNS